MKKVIITLACLTMVVSGASAQGRTTQTPVHDQSSTADAGKFKFKEETHDYGQVPEGPLAEYDFDFKNTGSKPIVISEAHGSCGCTVPKWPKEPIMPGKSGSIHVSYNTAGRQGMIQKDIIITSNAQQNPMILHITGTVKPKQAETTVIKG